MDKSKNPKSNKKTGILLVVVLALGGGSIAWDQGLFGSKGVDFGNGKGKLNVRVPKDLPENAQFILSEDPSKPSKIIKEAPAPQRVQTAKDLSMIVGDYIDSSPDKDEALKSLKNTMSLTSINKEYMLQTQSTEISRMKFLQKEWDLKLEKLVSKGLDAFEGAEVNEVQSNPYSTGTYSSMPDITKEKQTSADPATKIGASDFILLSVTEDLNGQLVALLAANGKEYEVKDKANINGQFDVKISSLSEVLICEAGDCITVY
jgi:hypothetical protein